MAAGLEAFKSAGLVPGRSNNPAEWNLEERHGNCTVIVYASSFPIMDADMGEVIRFLQSNTEGAQSAERLVFTPRNRLLRALLEWQLNDDDEAAFARLSIRVQEVEAGGDAGHNNGSKDANII